MSDVALHVENIYKRYELGTIGSGSLKRDLQQWWSTSVLKKEDAHLTENASKRNPYLWALSDVSFEIKSGEVWGFVGSNGAGKSTLLKIISRIVKPTKGYVRGRGIISSLLEVGTGFHQELSGRENIYLSGYILGMKKEDIRRNFDAIVDFSGIEKFIDTPVKRYSSGMYVRLAFAIAAHLEPDILIIDEVLAVGDAEFQKKCLGKMNEVSQQKGRTILFVSHNMQAIKQLCSKAMWLKNGTEYASGEVTSVVNKYISSIQKNQLSQAWDDYADAPGNEYVRIKKVELLPQLATAEEPVDIRTSFIFKVELWNLLNDQDISLGFHVFSYSGECIFDVPSPSYVFKKGVIEGECKIPGNFLNDGSYYISVIIVKDTSVQLFYYEECISFEIADYRENIKWYGKWMGSVRPQFPFPIKQINYSH